MTHNQPTSDNNIHIENIEYKHKTCAGLRCNNVPTYYLKVALIKKSGWFCDTCRQNLQEDDLVEFIFKDDVVMGGESRRWIPFLKLI